MASTVRPENLDVVRSPLGDRLRSEPYTFDFFQAVRLLERMQPERQPVGGFSHPRTEVARFGANPSLSFPASQIQALAWERSDVPRVVVNFMGLTGPLGVLPHYYTELVADRVRARDTALRDFLDIFHHRIISLFYQAWEKYRFTVGYERDQQDPFSQHLLDLIGLGTPGLQKRLAVRDETLVFYGGFFGLTPRSAAGLESILSDYFEVDVEIEPFMGVWRALDVSDQCCFELGAEDTHSLGVGVVAGDEMWDQQSRLRIKLGPLAAERYLDFLPTGAAYQPLRALAKAFCGNDLEFEVQLVLKREEVPPLELGRTGEAAPQLGWFTWVKSKPQFDRDPGDTILLLS